MPIDCSFLAAENQMGFVNAHLTSTVSVTSGGATARVIGNTSIYVGNRAPEKAILVNVTPQGHSARDKLEVALDILPCSSQFWEGIGFAGRRNILRDSFAHGSP
jgi:hypothetical protein